MSSEAETQQQQPPQPAADVESPSSPAAAATAGDKKVIGKHKTHGLRFSFLQNNVFSFMRRGFKFGLTLHFYVNGFFSQGKCVASPRLCCVVIPYQTYYYCCIPVATCLELLWSCRTPSMLYTI